MKYTFHVPTQQYGFLEIEGEDKDLPAMEKAYNKYAEKPINFKGKGSKGIKMQAWVGGEIWFDEAAHVYTNDAGDVYLSGSKYADSFNTPFDSETISLKVAEKAGVDQTAIVAMWNMKREISVGLGLAIHGALELRGKYAHLADKTTKDYSQHDHPVIKQAVDSFFKGRKEQAIYEALVVDHDRKYAGQIDRLSKVGETYYVEDFKTNADMPAAKLKDYWKQLSFYASILEAGGKKVGGLKIHHWNGGEWKTHEHKLMEVV